jgi:hypothetical protein
VEGFGGGIRCRDLVEGFSVGKWWRRWWRDLVEGFWWREMVEGFSGGVGGGIWWREMRVMVEALVEGSENGGGVGGGIWWRDLVEALVEGFGGGKWWSTAYPVNTTRVPAC